MSSKKGKGAYKNFYEYFYGQLVPRITSVGAAVVIIGALFKIMHWEGAGTMLTVGLLTEAFIFLLGVAMPIHPENERPDWAKIFPELNDPNIQAKGGLIAALGNLGNLPTTPAKQIDEGTAAKMAALEKALAEKINPATIDQFGKGMQDLSNNVAKMTSLTDASVATNDYAKNVKLASNAIVEMNKSFQVTADATKSMANATNDVKAYQTQLTGLTKNLEQLNAIYEVEVKNTDKNVKAMGEYFAKLTTAIQNVTEASKDTQKFKEELSALTGNLTSLNKIYGGMLAAMKS
ncbi:MAG TPA: gliding motility protein GldL [Microscillaceae bacterium]|nr:gliding motility protein GldL [Microscillaceae bacterium]